MKKKILLIVIVVAVIIVLILTGWYVAFCKLGVGPAFPFLATTDVGNLSSIPVPLADDPLIADVGTEEEAQQIAEQYGITLASYGNGIATYQTDKDPFEVIAEGEKKGYPQLSLNLVQEALETNDPVDLTNPAELQIDQYVDLNLEEKK